MTSLSLSGTMTRPDFDTSNGDADNEGNRAGFRSQRSHRSISVHEGSDDDAIVSVTVEKDSTTQKAGIGLVERKERVYISSIAEKGLFDQCLCEVGDVILAVNGQRLSAGQGAGEVMHIIAQAKTAVTLLLKKKAKHVRSRSQSQRTSRTWQKSAIKEIKQPELLESDIPPQVGETESSSEAHRSGSSELMVDSTQSSHSAQPSKDPIIYPNNDVTTTTTATSNQTANVTEIMPEHSPSPVDHTEPASPTPVEGIPKKQKSKKGRTKSTRDASKSPGTKSKKSDKRSTSVRESRSLHTEELTSTSRRRRSSLSHHGIPADDAYENLYTQSLSPTKQSSSKISLGFDYDSFEGDFLKITVRKESETKSGIVVDKVDGTFILVGLPPYEKRRVLGMPILAINGQSAFHTVSKAMDVMNRTQDVVRLVLDFSSPPVDTALKCPRCSADLMLDSKNVVETPEGPVSPMVPPRPQVAASSGPSPVPTPSTSSRKIAYRKVDHHNDEGGGAPEEMMSVAQSERTFKVNNRAPPGTRRVPRVKRPPKYQVDEFASDSDG